MCKKKLTRFLNRRDNFIGHVQLFIWIQTGKKVHIKFKPEFVGRLLLHEAKIYAVKIDKLKN